MKGFIEKLIGRLEEERECARVTSIETVRRGMAINADKHLIKKRSFEKAIEIVKELAEEYKGGWIPVTERLPSVGMTVLCYWKKYDRYDNTTSYYYTLMHRNEDCQWLSDLGVCNGNVLAWQPLPEPYKEEGEKSE